MGETAEMARWREALNKAKEKKRQYEEYLKKLQDLASVLPEAKSDLSSAENTFNSGGYNIGTPFMNGDLSTCGGKIDEAVSILQGVIAKTQAKIGEIDAEIATCQANYNQAVRARDAQRNAEFKANPKR